MANYAAGYVAPPDTSNWPKNPKYPFPTGDNYQGEDPSGYWIYGPDNLYHPNAQTNADYNQSSGITPKPPKQPGLGDTLLPIAGAAGALAAGQYLGQTVLPGAGHAVTGLFGGGAAATTPTVAGFGTATGAGAATGTAGADLASAAPFSFGGPGAAPAAAVGSAPATPTLVGAGSTGAAPFSLGGGSTLGSTASGFYGAGGSTVAGQGLLGATGASPLLAGAGIGAGAAVGLEQGTGLLNAAQGQHLDFAQQAALALPTFGLSFAANPIIDALGIGHSKNYYDAKERQRDLEHIAEQLRGEGAKSLSFQKDDGTTYDVSSHAFRHDPTTFNYDQEAPTMAEDIGAGNAAAYFLGFKPGSKQYTDWSGLIANARRNGVSAGGAFSGLGLPADHDHLYGQVILDEQAGKIDKAHADILKNGLDQTFHVGAYAGGAKPQGAAPFSLPQQPAQQAVAQPVPQAQPQQTVKPAPVPVQAAPRPVPQPVKPNVAPPVRGR